MSVTRLLVCIVGVYATFLLWAIAQERLSAPFPSTIPPHTLSRFPSPLTINALQSLSSCLAAAGYLFFNRPKKGWSAVQLVGWDQVFPRSFSRQPVTGAEKNENGNAVHGEGNDGVTHAAKPSPLVTRKSLLLLLLQVSMFQTTAGPIGFASLRYVSYPMMVLAKSCKLIPVLLLNVLIYRRRFKPYKYLVVALVSAGIAMFMYAGGGGGGKRGAGEGKGQTMGLALLGVNLIIDGLTNATQDELFSLHPTFAGQQLMFNMSFLSLLMTLPILLCPPSLLSLLPSPLASLLPSTHHNTSTGPLVPPLIQTTTFLLSHPAALPPLIAYAALGGAGQLFIFETIAHFGSLSLVMLTVTRKLVTMLLSVVLFKHQLQAGQWVGVAVVFVGIAVEAGMKRREILSKQIMQEQQKSKLKAL